MPNPTHKVVFWIKPRRKKVIFSVDLPLKETGDAKKVITENYANRGHNPFNSTGKSFFVHMRSIVCDAMEEIDAEKNNDYGVLSVVPLNCF